MFTQYAERVKRLTIWDIGLIKWSVFFFALIIAKIFPQLLELTYPLLIVLVVALGARPVYVFWMKK